MIIITVRRTNRLLALQLVLCFLMVMSTTAFIVHENESRHLVVDDNEDGRVLATKADEIYHHPEDYLDDDDDDDEYHLGISGLGKGKGSSGKGSSGKGSSGKGSSSKSSKSSSSSYDNVFDHDDDDDDDGCWCDYRLRRRRTTRGAPRRGLGVGCVCPGNGDDDDDDDSDGGKGKGGKGGGDDDDDDGTGKGKGGKGYIDNDDDEYNYGGKGKGGKGSSSDSNDYDDDEYNHGGKGKRGPSLSPPTRPPSSSTSKPTTRSPTRSPTKAPATRPSSPSSPTAKSPTRPPTRSPTRSPNSSPSGSGGDNGGGNNQPSTPTNGGGGGEPSATPPSNTPPSPSSPDNGGGGGGGNNGDDDDDISRPTPAGTPTSSPPPATPSTPTDGERDPPTDPPNENGTPNGTPSSPPESAPPALAPSNGGGPSPTNPPNRCTLSGSGLFGADVGISEQFDFQYQTLVIPSVTVAELNLDMLGSVEQQMGEDIVERVFPQCSNDPGIAESLAKSLADTDVLGEPGGGSSQGDNNADSAATSQSSRVHDPDPQDEGPSETSSSRNSNSAYVMNFGNRRHLLSKGHHRSLQGSAVVPLDGFSSRPRDTVIEGLECDDVDRVFPCYVVQCRVTTYASTILNDATRQQIRTAIRQSIETGNLATADNRFLDVTWRDFNDDAGNGGGGTPVDAPAGAPSDGDGGSGPTDPNGVEIDRSGGSGGGLEPWAIALIAVGGVILLVMAYLCIRRPRRNRGPVGDEDGDGAESSSYDEASYESFSKSVEDQINLHGGLNEENYEASAPVVAASALPIFTELDGPILEESEGDYSIEVESQNEEASYSAAASTAAPSNMTPDRQSGLADLEALSQAMNEEADFEPPKSHEPLYVRDLLGARDESDSAYSSCEEVVEEEYEIDYAEETEESIHSPQEDWLDEHKDEQEGSKSSFKEMRRKWEKGGR